MDYNLVGRMEGNIPGLYVLMVRSCTHACRTSYSQATVHYVAPILRDSNLSNSNNAYRSTEDDPAESIAGISFLTYTIKATGRI